MPLEKRFPADTARPPAGDDSTAASNAESGPNGAPGVGEVLQLALRRAEGALQRDWALTSEQKARFNRIGQELAQSGG